MRDLALPLPVLPLERHDVRYTELRCDPELYAFRSPPGAETLAREPNKPDNIFVAHSAPGAGCYTTTLTPAMVVHLANTQLTDAERAAITFTPAIAGGHTE